MTPTSPIYDELITLIRSLDTEKAELILKLVRAIQGIPISGGNVPYDINQDPLVGFLSGDDLKDASVTVKQVVYGEHHNELVHEKS